MKSFTGFVTKTPRLYDTNNWKKDGKHTICFELNTAGNARYNTPIRVLFDTDDVELAKYEIMFATKLNVHGNLVCNPQVGQMILMAENLELIKILDPK